MTSFDRREEAFEAKFAHDEERAFKARARALRMLGLWAAEKRGETGKLRKITREPDRGRYRHAGRRLQQTSSRSGRPWR